MNDFPRLPYRPSRSRGFTLIELLVVIAIISLLASVTLSTLSIARQRAQVARSAADLNTIRTSLELYYDDHGDWPPTGGFLAVNTTSNGNWSSFMTYLHPYVPDITPAFDSIGTNVALHQGYSYLKADGITTYRVRTSNSTNGAFVACLTLTKGFWMDFAEPIQTSATLNDNGVDPDGIELIDGQYTVSANPADCAF